jgi:hypothetical protein
METTKCPKCGATNADKNMACVKCGTLLHLIPCPKCGASNSTRRRACHECGAALHADETLTGTIVTGQSALPADSATPQQQALANAAPKGMQPTGFGMIDIAYLEGRLENASGYGARFTAPQAVRKWNWGAFWLTWIWGMNNNVRVAFAWFIPIAGWFVVPFILGARGSEWAWQSRRFERGTNEFHGVQDRWNAWGWIIGPVMILLILWGLVAGYNHAVKTYQYYQNMYADIQRQIDKATKDILPGGKGSIDDIMKQYKDALDPNQ